MEDLTINDTLPPAAGRFQFRLQSVFILMAIVAFAFGLVPLWYRNVIIPEHLPFYLQFHEAGEAPPFNLPSKAQAILNANRFTLGFSLIGFVGCCGIWYARISPLKRKSDFWLGWSFGLSLGFVAFPFIWSLPFLWISELLGGLSYQYFGHSMRVLFVSVCLLESAFFSWWPLLIKRYKAALLLFAYRSLYEALIGFYAIEIVSRAID